MVGRPEHLKLLFWNLVVIVVQHGVEFEEHLNTVEKLLVIYAKLKEVDEDKHVVFENVADDVQEL